MADDSNLSGAELQQSQATGAGGGEFTRDRMQGEKGGTQLGGGAGQSDMASPGGSSGTGGYGNAQNQANHQGQQTPQTGRDERQSRGERFDEEQGGGRGVMFDGSGGVSDFADDQVSHQDRGQSEAADFDKEA